MQNLVKFLRLFCCLLAITSTTFASEKINLNKANALELVHIVKGIGIKKAQAIVTYRNKHGEFKTIDELSNVPRIGKKFIVTNKQALASKLTLH
jgi:competence protein ComEA